MDLAKAIIYRLIFGTYKKPNEKILEYATMFHRKGEIFEYLDTSPEIIGKAVNEGRTDIIMYIIGNNQKIAEKDSIEEKIKKNKRNFKGLDKSLEIDFLDILYLSYSDLGEDQFSVHEKYYPLHITSSAVSELHYKIGRILQKKNSSTIKLHNNKEIIKLVQFIEGVKDIGISSKRKQKDIEIPDYIICFSPSNLDATLSSHEIAHKFGFVHVLDPFDIMNDPAGFCFHFIKNSDKKFRKWSKKQWKFIKGFYES